MSGSFAALRIHRQGDTTQVRLDRLTEADLPAGDVTIDVSWSDLNYKDGRVMETGSGIPRHHPLVPGIDCVGAVATSDHPAFAPGDVVVVNGFGLGTDRDGGLTQRTRVPGDWLMRVPHGMSARTAAAIGTAGYTAGLAVDALAEGGVQPGDGPILVTGAAGGVGTVAVMMLARAGYEVVASTGRADELASSLEGLGASSVVPRLAAEDDLAAPRWAGVIDSAGSATLASALATTRYGGIVAAVGLAQGVDLPTSVLPFILRGVTLRGIDSVYAPHARRVRAWQRAAELDAHMLETVTTVVSLHEAAAVAQRIVAGEVHGRVVVDVTDA